MATTKNLATVPSIDLSNAVNLLAEVNGEIVRLPYSLIDEKLVPLEEHIDNESNPHKLDTDDIGAATAQEVQDLKTEFSEYKISNDAELAQQKSDFNEHKSAKNPHGTTASDVGALSNCNGLLESDASIGGGVTYANIIAKASGDQRLTVLQLITNPNDLSNLLRLGMRNEDGSIDKYFKLYGEHNMSHWVANNFTTTQEGFVADARALKYLDDTKMHTYNITNQEQIDNPDSLGVGFGIGLGLVNNVGYVTIHMSWIILQFKATDLSVNMRKKYGSNAISGWKELAIL